MQSDLDDRQWADNLDYLGFDQGQAEALLRHKPAISNAIAGILEKFYIRTAKHPALSRLFVDAVRTSVAAAKSEARSRIGTSCSMRNSIVPIASAPGVSARCITASASRRAITSPAMATFLVNCCRH